MNGSYIFTNRRDHCPKGIYALAEDPAAVEYEICLLIRRPADQQKVNDEDTDLYVMNVMKSLLKVDLQTLIFIVK